MTKQTAVPRPKPGDHLTHVHGKEIPNERGFKRSRSGTHVLHTWRNVPLHEIPGLRYARISDSDPDDFDNVDRQERVTTGLTGYNVTHPTIKDNDRSASMHRKREREGFEQLLGLLDDAEIGVVLVAEWSRLVRDETDLGRLFRIAKKHGALHVIAPHGLHLDLATTFGKQYARMLTMQSAGESDSTSERRSRNLADLRKQGRVGAGVCTYGWLGKRHGATTEDGRTQHPDEAAEVRCACLRFVDEGWSLSEIARDWNRKLERERAKGLPLVHQLPRGGRAWDATKVRNVLANPRNAGILRFPGEPDRVGDWDPIIDRDTFERIVAKIELARRVNSTPGPRTLVTSLMFCGECKARLIVHAQGHGRKGGPYRYWKCKRTASTMHVCGTTSIRDSIIEPAIVAVVFDILRGKKVPGAPSFRKRKKANARKRRDEAMERFAIVAASFRKGNLGPADYAVEEAAHEAILRELDAEVHDVDTLSAQQTLINEGERIIGGWDDRDRTDDERNEVLRAFIERVEVYARTDNDPKAGHDPRPLDRVQIVWRKPAD